MPTDDLKADFKEYGILDLWYEYYDSLSWRDCYFNIEARYYRYKACDDLTVKEEKFVKMFEERYEQ